MAKALFTTVMPATNFKDLSLGSVGLMVSGLDQLLVVSVRNCSFIEFLFYPLLANTSSTCSLANSSPT